MVVDRCPECSDPGESASCLMSDSMHGARCFCRKRKVVEVRNFRPRKGIKHKESVNRDFHLINID